MPRRACPREKSPSGENRFPLHSTGYERGDPECAPKPVPCISVYQSEKVVAVSSGRRVGLGRSRTGYPHPSRAADRLQRDAKPSAPGTRQDVRSPTTEDSLSAEADRSVARRSDLQRGRAFGRGHRSTYVPSLQRCCSRLWLTPLTLLLSCSH